jgi:hypothetical protein
MGEQAQTPHKDILAAGQGGEAGGEAREVDVSSTGGNCSSSESTNPTVEVELVWNPNRKRRVSTTVENGKRLRAMTGGQSSSGNRFARALAV